MKDIKDILEERRKTHGDYTITAEASQGLKNIAHTAPSWKLMDDAEREATDMALHKVARIVCGNPHEPDHWQDIIGYAQLVLNNLEKKHGNQES